MIIEVKKPARSLEKIPPTIDLKFISTVFLSSAAITKVKGIIRNASVWSVIGKLKATPEFPINGHAGIKDVNQLANPNIESSPLPNGPVTTP